jgi:hypothetical protein
MNDEQLTNLKTWFDGFIAGFYSRKGRLTAGDDDYVNTNIKIKEEHTNRVCDEMLYLADELHLNENLRRLAETIALLHDAGRFPQFIKYKTFNDPRSINHCELALEVIKNENLLADLAAGERESIETAIKHHGDKELPADLAGDAGARGLLSKMIRDADKLDIYRVLINAYIQHRNDPDSFNLEIEFPDLPGYTPAILDAVLSGRLLDYKTLRCWNDMKLCILGWVYDVNFPAALEIIKQRRYLESILEFLPENEDTRRVRDKIFAYVDSRIKQSP